MDIVSYLKEHGACISSQLIKALEDSGCSRAAARKRISRSIQRKEIRRLAGITFPKQASFLYHESTFNSPSFWDVLIKSLDSSNPTYAAAIHALAAHGGITKLRYFPIISGAPIRQSKQISWDAVLERLKSIELVQKVSYEEVGEYITFNTGVDFRHLSLSEVKAKELAENILVTAVRDWARKLNIVSYDSVKCRDDEEDLPRGGTFHWDICGPSFLRSFRKVKDGKMTAGFFVCDVAVDTVFDEKTIQAFIRKCRLTSYLRNMPPFIFCLVARGYTKEAFHLAKSEGIMACTTENLLGKDISEGLSTLLSTMTRLGEMAVYRPEVINELFSKLGGIEGAAKNMRGSLFELLVGHCVKKQADGSIDIGKRVRDLDLGKDYEIDVFRIKENREVWIYECKAHQPTERVKLEDVEYWCKQRVAPIFKILSREERFRKCEFNFEFWSCGTFEDDAKLYLEDMAKKTKRYSIGFKCGNEVREYIKSIKPKSVLDMFDEHFYKHPTTKIENNFLTNSETPIQVIAEQNEVP